MKYQNLQYNLLNLPSRITYQDGRMINYIYSATGTKLSVTYTNGGTIKNNQYCGNMLYENGTLKQILIDGGYITFNGSTPQYHFYLKDHLGNNRVVVNASGTVEQVNHYYPFGGLMGESTNGDIQRYKYNGKELDRMNGLDWYDYGARHMDGIRFTTMDPMAEKYYGISPYVYCADNPVKYVDLHGDSIIVNKYGEDLSINGKDKNVYVRNGDKYTQIGEIGNYIKADHLVSNMLNRNADIARNMSNPIEFYNRVKTGGSWDLKNLRNSIWEYAANYNTSFMYKDNKLNAADIGNLNFGVVAKAFGIPQNIALRGAGLYQIYSGTSNDKWLNNSLITISTMSPSGIISSSREIIMSPPYGDDPRDQHWIKEGYKYK